LIEEEIVSQDQLQTNVQTEIKLEDFRPQRDSLQRELLRKTEELKFIRARDLDLRSVAQNYDAMVVKYEATIEHIKSVQKRNYEELLSNSTSKITSVKNEELRALKDKLEIKILRATEAVREEMKETHQKKMEMEVKRARSDCTRELSHQSAILLLEKEKEWQEAHEDRNQKVKSQMCTQARIHRALLLDPSCIEIRSETLFQSWEILGFIILILAIPGVVSVAKSYYLSV